MANGSHLHFEIRECTKDYIAGQDPRSFTLMSNMKSIPPYGYMKAAADRYYNR